jgi:hypothetical protein
MVIFMAAIAGTIATMHSDRVVFPMPEYSPETVIIF